MQAESEEDLARQEPAPGAAGRWRGCSGRSDWQTQSLSSESAFFSMQILKHGSYSFMSASHLF